MCNMISLWIEECVSFCCRLQVCRVGDGGGGSFFEAIEIMDDYRKAGKIRFLGISDWDCKKIMKYIEFLGGPWGPKWNQNQ